MNGSYEEPTKIEEPVSVLPDSFSWQFSKSEQEEQSILNQPDAFEVSDDYGYES
jgi:hypothetical protein